MTRVLFIVTDANKSVIESWAAGDPENDVPAKAFDCVAGAALQAVGGPVETTHWMGSANATPDDQAVLTEADGLGYIEVIMETSDVITVLADNNLEPLGYVEPAPTVPSVVSRSQAKIAMSMMESPTNAPATILDDVNAMIGQLEANNPTRIAWEEEPNFERGSVAINTLGAGLGLDSDALDALFIAADNINV